ncbi:MAG TPA: hypothetical protein VL261_11805 [Nitrospira sp.]|nr:hypothetical protein [Nitrospira sp.]
MQTVLKSRQSSTLIPTQEALVILGSGYVARFMPSLHRFYTKILYTSRDPDHHLAWVPQNRRIRFDLAQPETWTNVPSRADLLWCFPAAPLKAVEDFGRAAGLFQTYGRLLVLGSTSAYDAGLSAEHPPPWLDETAPVDFSKPRVQGEEFLRKECAATLLRIAGIYGPGRNPYQWIRSGRVSLSEKYVNLIHVEDLAEICLAALRYGVPGAVYNVSDGIPRTWREIGRQLDANAGAHREAPDANQQSGKRINTAKLRLLLQQAGISIRHPDLFLSLERLDDEKPGIHP